MLFRPAISLFLFAAASRVSGYCQDYDNYSRVCDVSPPALVLALNVCLGSASAILEGPIEDAVNEAACCLPDVQQQRSGSGLHHPYLCNRRSFVCAESHIGT